MVAIRAADLRPAAGPRLGKDGRTALTVARPGRIKIVVHNTGRLTHNLVIQIPPKEPDDKPVEVPGARVKSMQPGEVAQPIKVTLAPGVYRLVCTIANHDNLGQYGELKVEAPR